MELTINIKDKSKIDFLINLLEELSFVEIIGIDKQNINYEINGDINDSVEDIQQKYEVNESVKNIFEINIPEEHKKILDKRLEEIERKETSFKDWEEIKQKYENAI